MLTPQVAEAAAALGRAVGARAPLDAPAPVVEETLAEACAGGARGLARAHAPDPMPTRWWWGAYAASWLVAVAAVLLLVQQAGDPIVPAIGSGWAVALLAWGAGLLVVVRRWVRDRHDEAVGRLTAEVAAAASAAASEEARRPGRAAPADPLPLRWPRPGAQPYGVSHRGAEVLVADWMRHLGAVDAEATRFTGDGGVDVMSAHCIAQVKNLSERTSVPVAQIRELAGVAAHDGRRALFFTSGTYSDGGIAFADVAGMSLFEYRAEGGALRAVNVHARTDLAVGLAPRNRGGG
ncbi:restriction endonuclease [Agromyces sp. SYSU T0242]|uniref:restriction endonuclease n=1 Tax=Agromyces litoreus TaxID=3158561 RepID=UPI0033993F11